MKNIFYALIILSVAILASCDEDGGLNNDDCLESLGTVVSEERELADFSAISLSGVANINLTQGSPQQVTVVTHEELIDAIETTVSNDQLAIEMEFCSNEDIDQLDINITIPDISALSISGIGNITSTNDINVDDLDLVITGVGGMDLQGAVDNLDIVSQGVGSISAFDLVSNNCDITLSGTGNVEVTVNTQLDVVISGAGNVLYRGNPNIDSNITGVGNLVDAN